MRLVQLGGAIDTGAVIAMRTTRIAIVCLITLTGVANAADVERQAKAIENKLMSPCCMTNTVAVHESPTSWEIRQGIRAMLAEGRTEREILDLYVEQYGPQILAIPDARGFNLIPYVVPLLIFGVGGVVMYLVLRHWQRHAPATEPLPRREALASRDAERLRRELDRLE